MAKTPIEWERVAMRLSQRMNEYEMGKVKDFRTENEAHMSIDKCDVHVRMYIRFRHNQW